MTQSSLIRRSLFPRKLIDSLVQVFSVTAILIAVGAMAWILISVVGEGLKAIDWGFLTNPSKPFGLPDSGIANALLGTILITVVAALVTIPLAVAAGIYLSEFGKHSRVGNILRFSANVMMGMPSVIVGLFAYIVVVLPTGTFSGLAGAFALGIIMFPVIMRTTEDMLSMVPYTLRESALALGMTRARTSLAIICRAAKNGLLTGIQLSIARVSGETVPLLFTAMFMDDWPTSFFSAPTANMPVLITQYSDSPFEEMQAAGWGAALVITLLVLAINIFTRVVFGKTSK